MDPIPGFKFANWERGFGDVHLVPDLSSLRIAAWQVFFLAACRLFFFLPPFFRMSPRLRKKLYAINYC